MLLAVHAHDRAGTIQAHVYSKVIRKLSFARYTVFDFSDAPLVGSAVGDAEGADVPVVVQASLQPRPNARIAWLRQLVTMP